MRLWGLWRGWREEEEEEEGFATHAKQPEVCLEEEGEEELLFMSTPLRHMPTTINSPPPLPHLRGHVNTAFLVIFLHSLLSSATRKVLMLSSFFTLSVSLFICLCLFVSLVVSLSICLSVTRICKVVWTYCCQMLMRISLGDHNESNILWGKSDNKGKRKYGGRGERREIRSERR